MRALCLIRSQLAYRKDAFDRGLRAIGYSLVGHLPDPCSDDLLVIWNRYGSYDETAKRVEQAGTKVLVVENGHLGKNWIGKRWFSMALGHNAGAGEWRYGGPQRWDSWGVEMSPWRYSGEEIIIFGQRGIGERAYCSPPSWAERIAGRIRAKNRIVRIREHPRDCEPKVSLLEDLANANSAITWNSAAATEALLYGVPIWFDCPQWIGAHAALPLASLVSGAEPKRDSDARLAMFRRLAWAMWSLEEVESGKAFQHLLLNERVAA